MKSIIKILSILMMLLFMACNHQTAVNDVNGETEVLTDTLKQVDTVEQVSIEPPHQMTDDELAKKAYTNGDSETLKSLAQRGNATAKHLCEEAGLNY
jgi:hypothetical protein